MKRPHPLTTASVLTGAFLFAILPLVLALLATIGGCGGASDKPTHADYYANVLTARWEQNEVLWRVHGGPPNPLGSEVRRTVNRGMGDWQSTMQEYIRFREARDGETEQITVRFVKAGSLGGDFFGNQTLGKTTLTYKPGTSETIISSALVELDSQLWVRLTTLRVIASHEGGCHGLGIRGHSPYPTDVCAANPGRSTPTSADARTFRLAYGGIE